MIRVLAMLFMAGAANAAPMGAAEFDARVTGKTIHYTVDGVPSGVEEYLPHQRSRWMGPNGECTEGTWFANNGMICFDYPDAVLIQCWIVEERGGRIHAYLPDTDPASGFISFQESDTPLPCPGPDLGV